MRYSSRPTSIFVPHQDSPGTLTSQLDPANHVYIWLALLRVPFIDILFALAPEFGIQSHKPLTRRLRSILVLRFASCIDKMPVFQETSHESRDFRILLSRELPLPRLSPRPVQSSGSHEKHEVVVIGVSTMLIVDTRVCESYHRRPGQLE